MFRRINSFATGRRLAGCVISSSLFLCAQAPPKPQDGNVQEMSSRDTPATFRAKVNLVLVPVVVRDRDGHAIGNLKKEDFQLFDKGKPQAISRFSVESGKASEIKLPPDGAAIATPTAPGEPEETQPGEAPPKRFVAYLFDDMHITFGDLAQARQAAGRHIDTLDSTDRAAIFSTSGKTMLDFTADREKLRAALLRLQPQSRMVGGNECPSVSYYQADLIVNKNDPQALQAATLEVAVCNPQVMGSGPGNSQSTANQQQAMGAAQRALTLGNADVQVSMAVLKDVVRRISAMPGQRSLILVSPGFLIVPDFRTDEVDIMDRAIRSNVVIGAVDARGLYVGDGIVPDVSKPVYSSQAAIFKAQYDRDSALAQSDVLAEFADSTGGTFFHNSNDLDEGFRGVATAPEFYYVLGFSPQNLKLDGSLHALKVTVKDLKGLTVQARRGYYVPKHLADPAEQARQEIEEAVFSRDELHDIPIELHTQFFKASDTDVKLSVLARVDLRHLHFRKEDGRNRNNLRVVAALFDNNGNYVTGMEKIVEMRLLDQTVQNRLGLITVKTSLDIKPGSYVVRLVVRDTEEQLMAAQTAAIEIPF
jgi:VWFA-related protein